MEIKLNSLDVVQIAKALKCGWLDLDKIESFKNLIEGYNPPKEITREELSYYLDCLYKGWGYIPTDKEEIKKAMLQDFNSKQLEKWGNRIEDGSIYKELVKSAFLGLVAVKGLGGRFDDVEPDFSFMDKAAPNFETK